MKRMRKVLLLFSLALLAMAFAPPAARAMTFEELRGKISKANAGETVTLTEDCTRSATVTVDDNPILIDETKSVTLDLKNFNIECTGTFTSPVFAVTGGSLTIKGSGQITGNVNSGGGSTDLYSAGGIFIQSGSLTVQGATIANCTYTGGAAGAGGVYVFDGTFLLTGTGSVTGCSYTGNGSSPGGVQVGNGTTTPSFQVSGSARVTGNTTGSGASEVASNVRLAGTDAKITVVGDLTADAQIGVTLPSTYKTAFTSGLPSYGSLSNFTSDDTSFDVAPSAESDTLNEAILATPWDALQAKLNVDGATVTLTRDYAAPSGGSSLSVGSAAGGAGVSVTLDLNGHVIDRGRSSASASDGYVIAVYSGSVLTLTDGSLSGGSPPEHTVAVTYGDSSPVSVTGGCITGGNNESSGGGVVVNAGGTFNMNGGTIINCLAQQSGGGVYVNGGTFHMTGGTIRNNHAAWDGGGVLVNGSTAVFTMSDGSILDNRSEYDTTGYGHGGGGVCFSEGQFTLSGGTISGNVVYNGDCGGVLVNGGAFTLSGAPVISGNYRLFGSAASNLYLGYSSDTPASQLIHIGAGGLKEGASVGVTLAEGHSEAFTQGLGFTETNAAYFTADASTTDAPLEAAPISVDNTLEARFLSCWRALEARLNIPNATVTLRHSYTAATTGSAPDGALTIGGETPFMVTLDLNGFTLNRGLTAAPSENTISGSVLLVRNGAQLTIKDGSTAQNGTITGGYADGCNSDGGGVFVYGGTLVMEGGTINVCTAANSGGGVALGNPGTGASSSFTMTGGTITDCTVVNPNGDVYLGGGVNAGVGTFTVSGNAKVTGNKGGTGDPSNVFVLSGNPIRLTDTLGRDARLSVTLASMDAESEEYTYTSGYITSGLSSVQGSSGCFISDNNAYGVGPATSGEVWLGRIYTISYDANLPDGSTSDRQMGTQPLVEGARCALGTNGFAFEHYTFVSWNTIADGTGQSFEENAVLTAPPTSGVYAYTFYAQWTPNTHTITFESEGSVLDSLTFAYGETVTGPADPTKDGYTFAGWNPALPETMPDEDLTLVAQWEEGTPEPAPASEQHTITFDSAGGSAVQPITQAAGTAITAPADPTKDGYTFAGWNPALPETMPDEDMTLVAQWTAAAPAGAGTLESGSCGASLTWTMYESGELRITGSGAMSDYERKAAPWFKYRARIQSVVLEDGVTRVGSYGFYACAALNSVTIRGSGVSVGERAFAYCAGLRAVTDGSGGRAVLGAAGARAFYGCFSLPGSARPLGSSLGEEVFRLCGLLFEAAGYAITR